MLYSENQRKRIGERWGHTRRTPSTPPPPPHRTRASSLSLNRLSRAGKQEKGGKRRTKRTTNTATRQRIDLAPPRKSPRTSSQTKDFQTTLEEGESESLAIVGEDLLLMLQTQVEDLCGTVRGILPRPGIDLVLAPGGEGRVCVCITDR